MREDAGYWILETGYWILDTGLMKPGIATVEKETTSKQCKPGLVLMLYLSKIQNLISRIQYS